MKTKNNYIIFKNNNNNKSTFNYSHPGYRNIYWFINYIPFGCSCTSISSSLSSSRYFSLAHSRFSNDLTKDSLSDPFYTIIPSEYITSNNKPITLFFKLSELNLSTFTKYINSRIPNNFVYTVFVKVRYNYDHFFMAGNQFGFSFSSEDDLNGLFTTVLTRVDDYMDVYNLTDQAILYIQVSFWQKDKKLLSEFSLQEPSHIPSSDIISTKENLNIPISINKDSLGQALSVNISNGFITNINLTINGNKFNFLDLINNKAKLLRTNHKDKITSFDENWMFYLLKDKYDYVLAVKILKPGFIEKIRFSLDGVIINRLTDSVINNYVIRKSGEREIILKNNKVISIKQNIKLKALENLSDKKLEKKVFPNNNIGVIDI